MRIVPLSSAVFLTLAICGCPPSPSGSPTTSTSGTGGGSSSSSGSSSGPGGAGSTTGTGGAGGSAACKPPFSPPAPTMPTGCTENRELSGSPSDVTLHAACSPYHVKSSFTPYGHLIIEAGVHVQLAQDAQIIVTDHATTAGWVDANGTKDAPVVFEADTPGAHFDFVKIGGASKVSSLHYTELRGGGSSPMGVPGTILQLTGTVPYLLDHVNLIDSPQYGLYMAHANRLDPTSDGLFFDQTVAGPIRFDDGMALEGFPTISVGCAPGPSNRVASADVTETMTWASQPVPFLMNGGLTVSPSGTTPTTLTLAAPNTLLFEAQGSVDIQPNETTPATLIADGAITFDAADPKQGWSGIILGGFVTGIILRGGTIAHAGHTTGPNFGAVTMNIQPPATWPVIENETIRDTAGLPGVAGATTACILHVAPCGEPAGKPDYASSGNMLTQCSMGFLDTCP